MYDIGFHKLLLRRSTTLNTRKEIKQNSRKNGNCHVWERQEFEEFLDSSLLRFNLKQNQHKKQSVGIF